MINLKSSVSERIDSERAKHLLSQNYKNQRPVRDKQVKFLAEAMLKGEFTTNNVIIARHIQSGEETVINGQHTLLAIIASNEAQSMSVSVYDVDSDADISLLYSTVDIGVQRTQSDTLRAFETSNQTGISGSNLNKIVAAVKYVNAGFPASGTAGINKLSPKETNEICLDWADNFLEF